MLFLKSQSTKQFYIGMVLFLVIILLFLHGRKQGADESHYLFWANSFFFDGDIFLLNQFEALEIPYHLTPTGFVAELRNFGTAIFWLPFYTLFSIASLLLPDTSSLNENIGDRLQVLFINWSSMVFILVAECS